MDPGWLILFCFLAIEVFVVLILIFPMPNNAVRGAVIEYTTKIWDNTPF